MQLYDLPDPLDSAREKPKKRLRQRRLRRAKTGFSWKKRAEEEELHRGEGEREHEGNDPVQMRPTAPELIGGVDSPNGLQRKMAGWKVGGEGGGSFSSFTECNDVETRKQKLRHTPTPKRKIS